MGRTLKGFLGEIEIIKIIEIIDIIDILDIIVILGNTDNIIVKKKCILSY